MKFIFARSIIIQVGQYALLNWFQDQPSNKSPYSIHNIVKEGNQIYGKPRKLTYGGEWIGPSKISKILESLVNRHSESNMAVYVPVDGTIYLDKVMQLCCANKDFFPPPADVLIPDSSIKISVSIPKEDSEKSRRGKSTKESTRSTDGDKSKERVKRERPKRENDEREKQELTKTATNLVPEKVSSPARRRKSHAYVTPQSLFTPQSTC